MEYNTVRAAEKASEVQELAQEAVISCWRASGLAYEGLDAETTARAVIDSFVQITPPEAAPTIVEFISLPSGGRGGGRSVKPGNLLLNMRKLFTAIASGVITTASVIGAPWTAPFAALVLWDRVWSGLNIDITEREAVLLWTMWNNRDLK